MSPSIDSIALDLPPFRPRFPWWNADLQTVAVLLGTSNVDFWQAFVALSILSAGYVTTLLHWHPSGGADALFRPVTSTRARPC